MPGSRTLQANTWSKVCARRDCFVTPPRAAARSTHRLPLLGEHHARLVFGPRAGRQIERAVAFAPEFSGQLAHGVADGLAAAHGVAIDGFPRALGDSFVHPDFIKHWGV